MATIKNTTGSKIVNIRKNGEKDFMALHCYVHKNGFEQVVQTKHYASEKAAIKWAKKVL